ncbi:MAG: amidohydrolase [Halanaeroarchaeum sp.]
MAPPADIVFTDAAVHTMTDPDRTAEAVAVRDGRVVRVDSAYEVEFLVGAETEVVSLDDRPLLPGFVDAHTHMQQLGQYQVHADLSAATDLADALDRLRGSAAPDSEWILGFGYDESEWPEREYPTREDLDRVSEDRPVAAVRVDMHSATLNSVALERLGEDLPDDHVETEGGDPTGIVVETAAEAVWAAIEPDLAETRELVRAAIDYAHEHGVTAVHDMVRNSEAPRVYREMDRDDDLSLRVRINYWTDHLDAMTELGLRTNHGSEFVRTGAMKTYTDGSIGSRTARVADAYEDAPGETGTWVVDPDALADIVGSATDAGYQVAAHAIGDVAVETVLDTYEGRPGDRHRVEHAELAADEAIERFADVGAVASMQPNFLEWAEEGGMYDDRLGPERRRRADRFRRFLDAGVPLAFGSDCMPMDPLYGIDLAVNAPTEAQRLSVTEALRAYTYGGAYAGFDEDRMGTVEPGTVADFVVLEQSPWEHPAAIADIPVAMTVVDGEIVYDGRND